VLFLLPEVELFLLYRVGKRPDTSKVHICYSTS
jgi:hypothetical protein